MTRHPQGGRTTLLLHAALALGLAALVLVASTPPGRNADPDAHVQDRGRLLRASPGLRRAGWSSSR